jgi:hypothetical protein
MAPFSQELEPPQNPGRFTTVLRHWQALGLKLHIVRGFKVSRDLKFVEKLEDII